MLATDTLVSHARQLSSECALDVFIFAKALRCLADVLKLDESEEQEEIRKYSVHQKNQDQRVACERIMLVKGKFEGVVQ